MYIEVHAVQTENVNLQIGCLLQSNLRVRIVGTRCKGLRRAEWGEQSTRVTHHQQVGA